MGTIEPGPKLLVDFFFFVVQFSEDPDAIRNLSMTNFQ